MRLFLLNIKWKRDYYPSIRRKTDSITSCFYKDFRALDRDIVISLSPRHTANDLADGSRVLAFFNLANEERVLAITAEKYGKSGKIRDLWRQKDIGKLDKEFSVKVYAHRSAFFKVK